MKPTIEVQVRDTDLECRMFYGTEHNCKVHLSQTRSWVDTSWNFGTVKVHLDEPTDPDLVDGGYEGYVDVDVYRLHSDGYRLDDGFQLHYGPGSNITIGSVFEMLGLTPIQTVLDLE